MDLILKFAIKKSLKLKFFVIYIYSFLSLIDKKKYVKDKVNNFFYFLGSQAINVII